MAADETRFFGQHYEKGLSWWDERFFLQYDHEKVVGEKTAKEALKNPCPNGTVV